MCTLIEYYSQREVFSRKLVNIFPIESKPQHEQSSQDLKINFEKLRRETCFFCCFSNKVDKKQKRQ